MPAVLLPNIGTTVGWIDEEDGWGDTYNKNFRAIDALLQARVVDKDLTAPPGSAPAGGSMYIVGASPTGAWAGQAGNLAIYQKGDVTTPDVTEGYFFVTPKHGWRVHVIDEAIDYAYDSTFGWLPALVKAGLRTVTNSTASAAVNIDRGDAASYLRFTGTGAKTLTFRANATHALAADSEFTIANRAASGNLTLVFSSPAVGNAPASGTLVLAPGMTVTVKRVTSDVFDVIGQTVAA